MRVHIDNRYSPRHGVHERVVSLDDPGFKCDDPACPRRDHAHVLLDDELDAIANHRQFAPLFEIARSVGLG